MKSNLLILLFVFSVCLAKNLIELKPLTVLQMPEVNKDFAISLGYNEDSMLNFTELATKYGYPVTEYSVVTKDGYILALYRIKGKKTDSPKKPTPVFLMHGFPDTAATWTVSGPEMALGYILADHGYDVWLGNTRGNRYSRKHTTLNPDTDVEFWDFTFHEHGIYDVPAMLDFIIEQTGVGQVAYLGHSQGTTNFFVMGSARPEYNKKIKVAALLAPSAFINHDSSILVRGLAAVQDELYLALQLLGYQEIVATRDAAAALLKLLCQYVPQTVCGTFFYLFSGYESSKYTPDKTLSAISGHYPAGSSLDNLKRYLQGVREDRFRRFDYGPEKNMVKYGSKDASDYNLTALNAPVALYCGKRDFLVNLIDAEKTRSALPNVVQFTVMPQEDWGHFDFTWGDRVPTDVAPKLLDLFERYNV